MKRVRVLAIVLSILFVFNNGTYSYAMQNGAEYELEKENFIEENENDADSVSENANQLLAKLYREREECQEKETQAREKLRKKLQEKEIYAIVYLADSYDVKVCPDKNSETIAVLQSADTVRISDFALEWTEDEEITPVIWFLTEFYDGDVLQQGYIEETYLAYSDELLKTWKTEFCDLFDMEEISLFSSETEYSDIEKFPYTYKILLKELKEKHPNWIFVPMNVNRDWNSCVNEQLGDYSWIYYNQPAEYLGAKINSTWHYASKAGIAYYMDPRNFLTESNIFMFEQNTYNASYHTEGALQTFLNNTFMKGGIAGDSEGRTYANVIYNSGKNRGLSPFNLAARVIQEQGVNGNSQMISGTYPGYEGYYNFYNIGASGKTDAEVFANGLTYAKEKGWNTRVKALDGGAAFIGNGYILKGQDTLYLQKFDLLKKSGYLHQYMQNIMAPYTEGRSMKSMYQNAGSLNSDFVFKIPVFLNMPKANPLLGISFEETKTELYICEVDGIQVPFLNEEGKTEFKNYKDKISSDTDSFFREKEIQINYEVGEQGQEISDDTTAIWTVADENIVSLVESKDDPSKAVIRALNPGTTQITAKVGKFKTVMEVTVHVPMVEAGLGQKEITLYQGQTTKLSVNYKPLNTTDDSDIEWWCSDKEGVDKTKENIIKIDNGSIYANQIVEEIYIHAKIGAFDGTQESLTCKVTVKPYTITFKDVDGSKEELIISGVYGKTLSEIEKISGAFPWKQTKTGYVFLGWYTEEGGKGTEITPDMVLNGDITAYPYFEEATDEFFVKPIGNKQYTGSRISPVVQVYDAGSNLLVEDRDYMVSYQNNLNVSTKDNKAILTVTGIGNYSKTKEITFDILPRNLAESTVCVSDLLLAYTGKMQKAYPMIKDENRTLQRDRDYVLEFGAEGTGAYIEAGIYPVRIIGQGNYTGEKTAYITITKRRLLKDAVLEKIKEVAYNNGEECVPDIQLTYGKDKLQENIDYTVSFSNHKEVGVAEAVITGIGNYAGTRMEKYRIVGVDIAKYKITGVIDKEYTSEEVRQGDYTVMDSKGNVLRENIDYKVSYSHNSDVGRAKIIISGIGSFQGELVESFSILPYSMEQENSDVKTDEIIQNYVFAKGGIKPEVTVLHGEKKLRKGVDYSLSYKNNENIGMKGNENAPAVWIIGKGNYTGKIVKEFNIVSKSLAEVQMTAKDIVFKNKKSFCFSEPVLKDGGRILIKEKDYAAAYCYEYGKEATLWDGSKKQAGEAVSVNDIPMPGTVIKVTVEGIGNYKESISCTYEIKNAPEGLLEEIEESRKENLDKIHSESKEYNVNDEEMPSEEIHTLQSERKNEVQQMCETAVKKENIAELPNTSQMTDKEKDSKLQACADISIQETKVNATKEANINMGASEERVINNGYAIKKIHQTTQEKEIIADENNFMKYLEGNYQGIQKILRNLSGGTSMITQNQKFLLKFLFLGCSIFIICVMIKGGKRKKED